MLKRKAYTKLLEWKSRQPSERKALLDTGARQNGKSYLERHLVMTEYDSFVELNLLENERARKALSQAADAQDFVNRLVMLSDSEFLERKTLVFIDEIQELPDVMTYAKFLVEDGRYDYAFSGSMLGTEFKGVRSFPVGFVSEIEMRPLDFEEFCWAIGVSEEAINAVRCGFADRAPLTDYLHEIMLGNFRSYAIVGGMPEVVQRFVGEEKTLAQIRPLQEELNRQYSYDISKYADRRALQVRAIFDEMPVQLEDEKAKFIVSSLGNHARYDRYEQDFLWLVHAGVALKTNRVTEPKPPLRRTQRPSSFKLYQSDTGMLLARFPSRVASEIYLDARTSNVGSIFENVVAQEIVAAGFEPYYYQTKKVGEVDFLIEGNDGVVAIEVKSGSDYLAHASLTKVMDAKGYDIGRGIVLCRSNFEERNGVLYAPWYATLCLPSLAEGSAPDFVVETHGA